MNSIKNISVLFLIFTTSIASSQVKFEVKASKKTLGINELLRIDFEINKEEGNFEPPSFAEFDVVVGPNTSVSNSYIDGKHSYKKTLTYKVSSNKTGKFNINAATLIFEGKTHKTEIIKIEVVEKDDDTLENDEDFVSKFNKGVHFIAVVSDSIITLKDSLTITYKLYISQDVGISNFEPQEILRNKDFEVEDIKPANFEVEYETFKGEKYRYVLFKTSILKPKQKGTYNFEGQELNITAEFPLKRKDIFGRFILEKVTKTIKTNTIVINVI